MAATLAVITVGAVYVSLGTSAAAGMLISPEGEIAIVIAAGQPAPATPGHPLGLGAKPYFMPLGAVQVWAISVTGRPVAVTVTF